MWRIPTPLMLGANQNSIIEFTSDTYIGDLHNYLNNPTLPVNVDWTINGCDLGEIQITNQFATGSTFTFTLINGGRILGEGGRGGNGGADFGAAGDPGEKGQDGTAAIVCQGFTVNVDADFGFLLGGGGGGGGGSYTLIDASLNQGDAGGGGGGGQGWSGGVGGLAGNPTTGVPGPTNGFDGSRVSQGGGGQGGGGSTTNSAGGDGGIWGAGGDSGRSYNPFIGNGSFFLYGGVGGRGGPAFEGSAGAVLNLNGTKAESQLRQEGRIKGETDNNRIVVPEFFSTQQLYAAMATFDIGMRFKNNGDLARTDSRDGVDPADETLAPEFWIGGTSAGIGSNYDIRRRGLNNDNTATLWDSSFPVTTWTSLAASQNLFIDESGIGIAGTKWAASLVEIRRSDLPTTADVDEHTASLWVSAYVAEE